MYDDSLSWEENLARVTEAVDDQATIHAPSVVKSPSMLNTKRGDGRKTPYLDRVADKYIDMPVDQHALAMTQAAMDEPEEVHVPGSDIEPHELLKEDEEDDYPENDDPPEEDSGERFELPSGHPVEPYYDRERERTWNTHSQTLPEKHEVWLGHSAAGQSPFYSGGDFHQAADAYAEAIGEHNKKPVSGGVVWTRDGSPFQYHDPAEGGDEDEDDGPSDDDGFYKGPPGDVTPSGLKPPVEKQKSREREPSYSMRETHYDDAKTWEQNLAEARLREDDGYQRPWASTALEKVGKGWDYLKSKLGGDGGDGGGGVMDTAQRVMTGQASAPPPDESSQGLNVEHEKLKNFAGHIGNAKAVLAQHGVKDLWNEHLNHPGLRALAVSDPGKFGQQVQAVRDHLDRASKWGNESAKKSIAAKHGELDELQKGVDEFTSAPTVDVNPLPDYFGKKGAADKHTAMALEHLHTNNGDTNAAVEHLKQNAGLAHSTAQHYVRKAYRSIPDAEVVDD